MWQLTRVAFQLIFLVTQLTPAEDVLLTPVDEACTWLSRINKRSFAACAQPIDVVAGDGGRLAFSCPVKVMCLVTANTFVVDATRDELESKGEYLLSLVSW